MTLFKRIRPYGTEMDIDERADDEGDLRVDFDDMDTRTVYFQREHVEAMARAYGCVLVTAPPVR